MNTNTSLHSARETVTGGAAIQSASNLVIDYLDEFGGGIFACATSSDFAIGSL